MSKRSIPPGAAAQAAEVAQPRRLLPLALKLLTALALFLWMIGQGKLDLSQLGILLSNKAILWGAIAFWAIGPVYLASLRWKMLLTAAGYQISLARSVLLQLIGFFFTTVMPGSLGGDFIKVYYLIKENPGKEKSLALWAILFDRLIGMFGLFMVGAVFTSLNFERLWALPLLRPVIVVVYGYILFFIGFMWSLRLIKPATAAPRLTGPLGKLLEFMTACRVYRGRQRTIVAASLLSTLSQGLSFAFFALLVKEINPADLRLSELGAIFPLGMLITTLPLSPGGLGVGHLAFEQLFAMVDMRQGANVYNVYFVSQTVLNLTGVVAYLLKKPGAQAVQERQGGAGPAALPG